MAANRMEKIFTMHISDRGLISEIFKQLKKVDNQKAKKSNLKCNTGLDRIFNRRLSNG